MTSTGSPGRPARVVVVEGPSGDGPTPRSGLDDADGAEFTVTTVRTADEAAAVLSDERVDCVVCRHAPPDVDAVDAVQALRSDTPGIPVVVVTAPARADAVLDSGATGVVQAIDGEVHGGVLRNRVATAVSGGCRQDDPEQPGRDGERRSEAVRRDRDTLREAVRVVADADRTVGERVRDLLELCRGALDASVATLSSIDGGEYRVEDVAADEDGPAAGESVPLDERPYCRRVFETGEPLVLEDAETARAGPGGSVREVRRYLGTPVFLDGGVRGTLCVYDHEHRTEGFAGWQTTLVELAAEWIGGELDRRERRQKLEDARERVEQTLERVDDAFFAVDREWHVTYVNGKGADVLRGAMGVDCDDGELVGRHLWEQIPEAVETNFYEQYHRALQTRESVAFEEYFEPLETWFEVRAYPDADGLSVYFTDVTDRKERGEELTRLGNLLEQTQRIAEVGGWEVDRGTGEVFWTDHLFDLLGFEGEEEPSLDEALDVYLPEDRPIVEDAVDAAIEDQESFDVEVRYRRSGEAIRWLRVRGVPIVEDGDVVTIRGTAQDVTERKERERTLDELLAATRRFIEAGDEAELLDAVLEGVGDVFEHEYALVRRYDPEEGTLPPVQVSSGAPLPPAELPTYDADEGFVGDVYQSGEPTVVRDLAGVSDHDYGPFDSAIVVPLGDYGTLALGALESGAFDVEEAALVELLALAAASAFDRLDREAETRNLKHIVDHVDQKVFLLDEEGRFAYATSALAAYLGRDRDQLVGTPLRDVVAPDDRDGCEDALDEVRSRVQNVDPEAGAEADSDGLTVEAEVGLSDGDRRPAQIELSSVGRPDVAAAVAGVVTDISELAATRSSLATERERFRELFENLPDPVAEVEFVGSTPIVRYVNPAFTEVFGYERTTAHGANLNELIVPETERVGAADLDSGAMRGEVTSAEVTRGATDGPRSFLLRGIPYSREGGTHGFAVYTDITEQKERERYLTVLNRVLRHNLRNDMTVVMALARRLARQVTDETLAGYARTLLDNAEDVATLSEKAKEIERVLGRRDGDGQTVPVDLAAKVRMTVAEQTDTHPCVELSVDVPDVLWVEGDDTIRRACEELVENAIEHSESESPQVAVEAREDPERDGWVELRVRDDGPGIPGSEWQIVTGEEEISQLSHGSGLGLWLTRWIVESHGGEIYRERSGDGAGTTVVLRLRRADPGSSAEPIGEREFA